MATIRRFSRLRDIMRGRRYAYRRYKRNNKRINNGVRRLDGSGRGVGNYGTSRQPKGCR